MKTRMDGDVNTGAKAGGRALLALAAFGFVCGLVVILDGDRLYLWIKAVHVIAVISWMAGMLYLPRLFIYHCDAPAGSDQSETFKIMERRLLRIIMTPAMVIAWLMGLGLAWMGDLWAEPWFLVKVLGVLGMTAAHGRFAKAVRLFASDANVVSARAWRLWNEVPTVLMIVVVILVILKPW